MRSNERFVYIAVMCLIILGAGALLWQSNRTLQAERSTMRALQAEADKLHAEITRLRQKPPEPAPQPAPDTTPKSPTGPISVMTEFDLRELKQLGLADPVRDLTDDLKKRGDLIPMKGVLGGTMAFHDPARWAFSRYWAIADFDDGHIAGIAMLKYAVAQGGKITWTLVDWKPL